jgi:hypothetical protein
MVRNPIRILLWNIGWRESDVHLSEIKGQELFSWRSKLLFMLPGAVPEPAEREHQEGCAEQRAGSASGNLQGGSPGTARTGQV